MDDSRIMAINNEGMNLQDDVMANIGDNESAKMTMQMNKINDGLLKIPERH